MPDYAAAYDREAREIAARVADLCRRWQRPVTAIEVTEHISSVTYHSTLALLSVSVVAGYLTRLDLRSTALWMPVGWGFGPGREGCCR